MKKAMITAALIPILITAILTGCTGSNVSGDVQIYYYPDDQTIIQVDTEYENATVQINGNPVEILGCARNSGSLYIFGVHGIPAEEAFYMTIELSHQEDGEWKTKERFTLRDVCCLSKFYSLDCYGKAKYFAANNLDLSTAANVCFMWDETVKDVSLTECRCDSDNLDDIWTGLSEKDSLSLFLCDGLNGDIETMRSKADRQALRSLRFADCSGLTGDIGVLLQYTNLEELVLIVCEGLYGDIGQLEALKKLKSVTIYGCPGITGRLTLPDGSVVDMAVVSPDSQ